MKALYLALSTVALAAAAGPALAGSTITGALAKLVANPPAAVGACPQTITFNGFVAVYGVFEPGHPVDFSLQFQRSDGAVGPVTHFSVSAIGKHAVSDTWTLGGDALPTYAGWEQIKAWPTNHEGGFGFGYSDKANFTVECRVRREGPAPRP